MSRIKLKALAIGVGIVGLMAGVGYAAIPSADGTISACKSNKGALKVIDAEAGQSCPDSQQLLTWNQQGPQGPTGPPGTAAGYAWVGTDGNVFEQRSLNVADANVTKPAGTHGVYCFHGLAFTPKVAVATPLFGGGNAGSGSNEPTPAIGFAQGCDEIPGHDLNVLMVDPSTGNVTRDKGFFVIFN